MNDAARPESLIGHLRQVHSLRFARGPIVREYLFQLVVRIFRIVDDDPVAAVAAVLAQKFLPVSFRLGGAYTGVSVTAVTWVLTHKLLPVSRGLGGADAGISVTAVAAV